MTTTFVRTFVALALAAGAVQAGAATVRLSTWAHGNSDDNTVNVTAPNHIGPAGGFKGAVAFDGNEQGFSGTINDFVTYCVEIEESFRLPSGQMKGYAVKAGSGYGKWDGANGTTNTAAQTSMRLGQLLSWVEGDKTRVDTAAESSSLQLAIWNVIYDTDDTVAGGAFREKSGSDFNAYADSLLVASAAWASMLDVFVLSRPGQQDFVLTRDTHQTVPGSMLRQAQAANDVPEPASLALVAVALGAVGVARRRKPQA